jgi:hypothetical protein
MAHRVISLGCGPWSLWEHSGSCPDLPLANPVANDPQSASNGPADMREGLYRLT